MKTHAIYIAGLSILLGIVVFLVLRLERANGEIDRKDSIIAEKNAEIEYKTSETGKIVAEKIAAEATAKEALEAYPEIVNQIKREFDIKTRDLKAFVQASFHAQGHGEASVVNNYYTDSTGQKIKAKQFTFKDDYLFFESTIFDDKDKADSRYTYSDSISMAFHVKRKWRLGKETLYASASLGNPNAKVTSSTSVLIKEAKDKRFFIGPMGGYDPFQGRFFLGVGVGYALFKF